MKRESRVFSFSGLLWLDFSVKIFHLNTLRSISLRFLFPRIFHSRLLFGKKFRKNVWSFQDRFSSIDNALINASWCFFPPLPFLIFLSLSSSISFILLLSSSFTLKLLPSTSLPFRSSSSHKAETHPKLILELSHLLSASISYKRIPRDPSSSLTSWNISPRPGRVPKCDCNRKRQCRGSIRYRFWLVVTNFHPPRPSHSLDGCWEIGWCGVRPGWDSIPTG